MLTQKCKKILTEVISIIERDPSRLNMGQWWAPRRLWSLPATSIEMGGCFGGFTLHIAGYDEATIGNLILAQSEFGYESEPERATVYSEARDVLGLEDEQALRLFHVAKWPLQFHMTPFDGDRVPYAEQARARLEFFLDTEGTDVEIPSSKEDPVIVEEELACV